MSVLAEADLRTVAFRGGGAGTYPCTWGQLDMRREMVDAGDPAHGNIIGGGFLRPGATVERVAEVVGGLVGRYESLRTRFVPAGDGRLRQEVTASGEVEVEVVEVGGDLLPVTMTWLPAMATEAFDLGSAPPLRVRVGTVDGEPRLVVLGMPHVTADFLASRVLFDELVRGLDGREPLGTEALAPRQVAAREGSPAGRRMLNRSLDHWLDVVADAPPACFAGDAATPETPRYPRGGLTTRALPRALDLLALRYGVGTSHVLLAATAALLGRCTGRSHGAVRMVAGNRGRPELRHAVGTLSQETAARVPFRADRFGDLVRGVRAGSLDALRHAWYDPDAVAGIVTAGGVALDVYFNDMWAVSRNSRGAPGFPDTGGGTEESVFAWEEPLDHADVAFFLETAEVVDDPAAVRVSLLTDSTYLPSPALRRFLLALEELLVTLAADDTTPLDRIPLRHDPTT